MAVSDVSVVGVSIASSLYSADYYTNGIAVNNSWKVHNVAKNKWFVLVAGSAEEKQSWMDAIRKEKEKRKRKLSDCVLS